MWAEKPRRPVRLRLAAYRYSDRPHPSQGRCRDQVQPSARRFVRSCHHRIGRCVARHPIPPTSTATATPAPTSTTTPTARWRQQNPIPDYMDRWSRRWQSGEVNKEHVRDILTELSAKTDWPKGSAGQLAGDFYAACMDESRVDALGSKPVQPWLADVDAIEDKAGVQRMIGKLHDVGVVRAVRRLRRRGPARSVAGRSRTSTPAAWACPTATTTSRPSRASSRRARSTSSTWRRCSSSPARRPDAGEEERRHRVRLREAPGRGLARQRAAARPEAAGPHDRVRRPAQARAELRLGRVLRRRRHAARCGQRDPAEVPAAGRQGAGDDAARRSGRPTCSGTSSMPPPTRCPGRSSRRTSPSTASS